MDKVCIITTLRATPKETMMFVNYHLNVGIDEMILFFDDPNDEAIGCLSSYSRITCIRCDEDHWRKHGSSVSLSTGEKQIVNVNVGLELAKERGHEWMVHIDSDELLFSAGDIKETLAKSSAEVLIFEMHEAVPEKEYYCDIFAPTLFRKPASQSGEKLARWLGCRKAFFEGEYFRGHRISKVAVRKSAEIKRMHIHRPEPKNRPLQLERTSAIKLLHYDCIGIDDWRKKWSRRLDGTTIFTEMSENRKRQLELFAEALAEGNNQILALYKRLYFIPKYERRILQALGMLTEIKLNRKLFNPS